MAGNLGAGNLEKDGILYAKFRFAILVRLDILSEFQADILLVT